MGTLSNIFWLGTKELRSFMRDFVLLALVIYAFSLAIIAQAQSSVQELRNASVVDEDHSELSRRIAHAFLPPYFQTPQPVAEHDIVPLMNAGKYTFSADAARPSSSMLMRPRWCRRGWEPTTRSRNRWHPPSSRAPLTGCQHGL